jgi:hypothetical protein
MTLQLLVDGDDLTPLWRVYESHWTMRAWQGEAAQSEFIIDDPNNNVLHANLTARKIVEVWEDATGTPICIYRGRIANKTLGQGIYQAPGHAMRWTLQCEDYNIDLRGIRVINATRPSEDDDDRVEVIRAAYLAGSGSTHPEARDSTDLGNTYIGNTPAEARLLPEETYTDSEPATVLSQIADFTGRVFFVYLNDDGTGELAYVSRDEMAILSDIMVVDDAEDENADGIDIFAAYKTPQAGDHAGQEVYTGGAVRYGGSSDGEYYEESNIAGSEAEYDKWERTLTNEFIFNQSVADEYLNTLVANSDESRTYFASIDMRPVDVHRVKAGMMVPLIRKRASKSSDAEARAINVTYNPIKPNADGESWYRVDLELGRPQFVRSGPRNRLRWPRQPTQPTADACTRWYFSINGAAFNPAASALWDTDSAGANYENNLLKTTADGTYAGTGSGSVSSGGGGGVDIRLGEFIIALDSATAAVLAAGGAEMHMQARARSRSGIGISEAAQDNISQITLRVFDSGGSLRGTPYAGHALGSSAGSNKWRANTTHQSRFFPPAAASNVLSAVSGTVAGDFMVVEFGYRSFTVGTTGGAVQITNAAADDLQAEELETTNLNSWFQICTTGGGGSETEPVGGGGSGAPGTSGQYAPIDHVHEHGLLSDDELHHHDESQVEGTDDYVEATRTDTGPSVTDDEDAGYRTGDQWIDRTANEAWVLTDATAGAAVWEQYVPSSGGGAPSTVNYLVGTADAGLSAEIVVGTTPGGELGGTWASPTVDAVHVDASHYQLNKLNGTTAPTVNDDSGDGYSVGSRWIDTTNDRVYTCTDATGGAAVWREGFNEAGGAASISGGTETTSGGYKYCAFTSNGTLTVGASGHVEVLIVGGGGGGGSYFSGGGGGAGDVVYMESLFLAATTYAVTVGAGGAGATGTTAGGARASIAGKAGRGSKLGTAIFASGGGGGLPEQSGVLGGDSTGNEIYVGASSGGGGGRADNDPGTVIGGGFAGGEARTGTTAGTGAGGGGGGASAVGANGTTGNVGGAGGDGVTISAFSAFGASGVFGGGGGGGGVTTGGAGGTGGGGHGGGTSANTGLTAGTANTGGGGGGGGNTGTTGAVGADGGTGVVLVRVPV